MTQVRTGTGAAEQPGSQEDGSDSTPPGGTTTHKGRPAHLRGRAGSSPAYRLDPLGWAGVGLLVLQGVAMLIWSTLLWHRFALTLDYSIYHQAWWLIAHGHLDPFDTALGMPFWQNHLELIMWPLALVGVVFPHGPVLLYVQDAAFVGTEVVAWRWARGAAASTPGWPGRFLAIAALVALLGDPWPWWAISFDFHMELPGLFFVVLAAYELSHQGRRRTWVWAGIALVCGAVVATYVAGLGLGAALAGRRWRLKGLALLCIGGGWTLFVVLIHGQHAAPVAELYGYLGGAHLGANPGLAQLVTSIATHPTNVLSALWSHRADIWANLAPGGFIGVFDPWALGISLPVLLANNLVHGTNFSQPAFQSALLYVVVPVGTVVLLVKLYRHRPAVALTLASLVAANAIGWAVVWGPQLAPTWLDVVPAASAAELSRADAMVPSTAEVIASQGLLGRFSDRAFVYALFGPGERFPVRTRQVWWVIGPAVGIELYPVADAVALISALSGPMHAQLMLQGDGIWVFRWAGPPDARSVTLPSAPEELPAWSFAGSSGTRVLSGPPSTWHLESSAAAGYVLAKDYWREPPGRYEVTVKLASSVPTDVEVWNATGDVLLARRIFPPTDGPETLSLIANAERSYPQRLFDGWGPFRANFDPRPAGNRLEVKVWSPGGGIVDVQGVALRRVGTLTQKSSGLPRQERSSLPFARMTNAQATEHLQRGRARGSLQFAPLGSQARLSTQETGGRADQ